MSSGHAFVEGRDFVMGPTWQHYQDGGWLILVAYLISDLDFHSLITSSRKRLFIVSFCHGLPSHGL